MPPNIMEDPNLIPKPPVVTPPPQLEIKPPSTAEQYDQNVLLAGLGAKAPEMPKDYFEYLKQTKDAAPASLGVGPTAENALHMQDVHKFKGTAGENRARIQGDMTGDAVYDAMIRNNPDHNPNLTYEGRNEFLKTLKGMPEEWQKYQDRLNSENTAKQQALTPEEVMFRSRLTPAGQIMYDQAKDQERLNAIFPQNPAAMATKQAEVDMTLAQQQAAAPAATALAAQPAQPAIAQPPPVAQETPEQQYAREQTKSLGFTGPWSYLNDPKYAAEAENPLISSLALSRNQEAYRLEMEDRAAKAQQQQGAGNTGQVDEYLDQALGHIDRMVANKSMNKRDASAARRHLIMEANKLKGDSFTPTTRTMTLSDGRKIDMVQTSKGTWSQARDEKAEKATLEDGVHDSPVGWEVVTNGKSKVYEKGKYANIGGKIVGIIDGDTAESIRARAKSQDGIEPSMIDADIVPPPKKGKKDTRTSASQYAVGEIRTNPDGRKWQKQEDGNWKLVQ